MISIIIPTYNRREEIKDLLISLKRQDCPSPFEIIIVDDGSTDGTRELLQSIAKEWGEQLRFLSQDNRGVGPARNLGIRHAQGDILVFVDSDCIAPPQWLKNLTAVLSDPQVGAAGGSELAPPGDSLLMKCFSYLMTAFLTTGGLRGKTGKKLGKYYPRGGNMAVRKQALDAVGGFINRTYGGEDIVLNYKVKQAGFLLKYAENASIYHHRRSTISQHFRQIFQLGKARIAIARLHRSLLEPVYTMPAAVLLFAVILAVGALLSEGIFQITLGGMIAALLFLTLIGIDSAIRLKTVKALVLVPFLFMVQQTAYGLGTIAAALRKQG